MKKRRSIQGKAVEHGLSKLSDKSRQPDFRQVGSVVLPQVNHQELLSDGFQRQVFERSEDLACLEVPFSGRVFLEYFKTKSMRLRGDGLYSELLIRVLSYLFVLRLKTDKSFSELSPTRIMRKLQREGDFRELAEKHFHDLFSAL